MFRGLSLTQVMVAVGVGVAAGVYIFKPLVEPLAKSQPAQPGTPEAESRPEPPEAESRPEPHAKA